MRRRALHQLPALLFLQTRTDQLLREHHKTLGVMCDGGMTERILLPARKVHPSSKLRFDQLALVENIGHRLPCHRPREANTARACSHHRGWPHRAFGGRIRSPFRASIAIVMDLVQTGYSSHSRANEGRTHDPARPRSSRCRFGDLAGNHREPAGRCGDRCNGEPSKHVASHAILLLLRSLGTSALRRRN